jgi:hypothetical protein
MGIIKKILPVFLIIISISCKTYQKVESIKSPKNHPSNNVQQAVSILENINTGDTITVIENKGLVSEMIHSEIFENRLIGRIYIDPESYKRVEPYQYSIDIHEIKQVKMVSRGPDLGIGSKSEFFFHHLYKVKKGERIRITGVNGNRQYMHFAGFGEGFITGTPIYHGVTKPNEKNWVSNKDYKKLGKKEIDVPLREIENIHIERVSAPATVAAYLGTGLLVGLIYYGIMNMELGFAVWD